MPKDKQIDDNQDDLGRDLNDPKNRIGDRATLDKVEDKLNPTRVVPKPQPTGRDKPAHP